MFSAKDYIYEVYREKSFTLASKKLFVSQPALSASVKKIEKEIGAELFVIDDGWFNGRTTERTSLGDWPVY